MISLACKKPLTQFQEAFCLQFIKSGNASDAYRAVSPRSKDWTRNALWVTASKMMAKPNVDLRITELRAGMAKRAIVTAESLADELDKAIAIAVKEREAGHYVAAVMGKAKLYGLLIHKKETRSGYLDDLDYDQLKILDEILNSIKGETTGATIASVEQPPPTNLMRMSTR